MYFFVCMSTFEYNLGGTVPLSNLYLLVNPCFASFKVNLRVFTCTHVIQLLTSTVNSPWCCIWSCRRCGSAFPTHTGSTRPCRWRWSSRGSSSRRNHSSLTRREKHTQIYVLSAGVTVDVCSKKRKERSQVPQSSQQSNVPVWNSVCWTRPGCVVQAMMEMILWKKRCLFLSLFSGPHFQITTCVFPSSRDKRSINLLLNIKQHETWVQDSGGR